MLSSYVLSGIATLASFVSASAVVHRDAHERVFARQSSSCIQVSVTFNELKTTAWGESVSVVGSIAQLGNWDTSKAIFMTATGYTASNPQWVATVNIPPGTSFQYKYIKFNTDGSVQWEFDPNHSYTVPNSCTTNPSIKDTWQSSTPTSTTSTKAATSTATPTPTCTNGPTTRNCWQGTFSIDTDFDTNWPTTGRTVSYDFDIRNTTMSPDGHARQVLAINNQYPGPTIYANWGDMISVTVHNNMPNNGTSIHWHGLRQWHKGSQDGVPGVNECPLAPGQSKTYTFQATQYGTSWYHSHWSSQYGDGVVGPIVIYGPATANYDLDVGPLPITDWYYPTVAQIAAKTMHVNAGPPKADSALINGSMVIQGAGSYSRTTLQPGKRHRLRLINTAVDNHFMVSLDNHVMQVITNDFVPIVPYNTTHLFLGIGQRYDVIITANQASSNYWFRAEVHVAAGCGDNWNNGNLNAIFSYAGQSGTPTTSGTSYTQRCTDETGLTPYWNSYVPDGQVASQVTQLNTWLNQTTNTDGSLTLYWNVNGSSMNADWSKPTYSYIYSSTSNWPSRANVLTLPTEAKWTYWVLQSQAGNPYNVAVPHPIHLHGHDFYILGTGFDTWNTGKIAGLDYTNPTRRDTAMMPAGGWLAIAFQTDNPGAWMLHCHIAWHADEGLAVQFLEAPSQVAGFDPKPSNFDSQCAAWNSYAPTAAYKKGDSGI
ncbi:hypothetical protein B0A48_10745 [Cryoendolithus antarcticus]|uniref:laccase n=1 Tax=Cryoendolithus antarcticus TaxID=1507870 RepID=A0A1V8SY98_9PEZI|nr:hypothetical protein B0A48_10745 [Cryoendolithus antarcticus]